MKIINYAFSFLLIFCCSLAFASWPPLSAARFHGETFKEASKRARLQLPSPQTLSSEPTAEDLSGPINKLNINAIPELKSLDDLIATYNFVRDTQFINDASLKFPRRLSWLYPDDGCFVRAELAAQFLKDASLTSPKKMYAFGNLKASTKNTKSGAVSWWYHVAVTYRLGTEVFIFDPAINSKQPLTFVEWHNAIGGEKTEIDYAICSAESFDPVSPCNSPNETPRSSVVSMQIDYLKYEWNRLQELHRDPTVELGDNPPWRQPSLQYFDLNKF